MAAGINPLLKDDPGLNGFDFLEFGNFSYIISLLTIEYMYSTKRDGGVNSASSATSRVL